MSDVTGPTKREGAGGGADGSAGLSVLLEEASGPVSPRYQYTLRVALEPAADGAALSVEATGAHGLGDEDASYQGTLSTADVTALAGELDAMAAFDAGRDFLGPEGRSRVGVSFNALTIARGDRKARIDYFLSSLKRDDAEPQRRVVARIKELAKRAFAKALHAGPTRSRKQAPRLLALLCCAAMQPLYETDVHAELRRSARRFAEKEIAPNAHAWEEAGEFPRELYDKAAAAGVLAISYPEAYGGGGGDLSHALAAAEELVLHGKSVGTVVGLGSHGIALPPILIAGNEEQKQRFVPPVVRGEKIAALAITEPSGGSDVARLKTRAVRDGDHYVINGAKTFITSGTRADLVTVAVRTGDAGHGGISMIVVEKGTPGFSVSKRLSKMGWWASDTAELTFEDCRVPAANLIGHENGGFITIMQNFATERLFLAGNCVAIAELAYRESVAYARERQAFGKAISGFQVVRHKLADMATRIAAARALTNEAVTRHLRGEQVAGLAAMAKNTGTDMCSYVCNEAVQIHGGYGYMREYVVERLYRDARLYPIGGGTREIMNEIISKLEGY